MEEKYFCTEGWTGQIRLKLLREIAVLAQGWNAPVKAPPLT
jgi:hypothetical protein